MAVKRFDWRNKLAAALYTQSINEQMELTPEMRELGVDCWHELPEESWVKAIYLRKAAELEDVVKYIQFNTLADAANEVKNGMSISPRQQLLILASDVVNED